MYGKSKEELIEHMLKVLEVRNLLIKDLGTGEPGRGISFMHGVIPYDGSLLLKSNIGTPSELLTPFGCVKLHNGGCFKEDSNVSKIFDRLGFKVRQLSEVGPMGTNYSQYFEIISDPFGNEYTTIDSDGSLLTHSDNPEDATYTVVNGFMEGSNHGSINIVNSINDEFKSNNYYVLKEMFEELIKVKPELKVL